MAPSRVRRYCHLDFCAAAPVLVLTVVLYWSLDEASSFCGAAMIDSGSSLGIDGRTISGTISGIASGILAISTGVVVSGV